MDVKLMDGAITWAALVPIVATLMGALVSVLLGMVIAGQNDIKAHLAKLNGTLFDHITQAGIHESAVVKIDEQIKSLLTTAKIAHERLDQIEEHRR